MALPTPSEAHIKGYLAVLEDALGRCWTVLKQPRPDKADLREGLHFLELAFSDAEYELVGVERPDWQMLRINVIDMLHKLLAPLKAFNPELNNWERAWDPAIPVQGSRLWSGGRRPFEPQRIAGLYEDEKKKVLRKYLPAQRTADVSEAEGTGDDRVPGPGPRSRPVSGEAADSELRCARRPNPVSGEAAEAEAWSARPPNDPQEEKCHSRDPQGASSTCLPLATKQYTKGRELQACGIEKGARIDPLGNMVIKLTIWTSLEGPLKKK